MTIKKVVPMARSFSNKALFVISSGKFNTGSSHSKASRILSNEHGFEIYAIGVGRNPNKQTLMSIASDPVKGHTIFLRYFGDVFGTVRRSFAVKSSKGENELNK